MAEPTRDAEAGPQPGSAAAGIGPREWFERLYQELRRHARGQLFRYHQLTLGPTTLLHEAWLRMADRPLAFATQAELVAYAGQTMRGIVINHIRARQAAKRGGELERVPYEVLEELSRMGDDEVLRVHDALTELAAVDARLVELVELRFFAGLDLDELAALRGVSERTVRRDWDKARMLLAAALGP
jgi:RNA polymerase sigma factor (TIGR02999 family)